MQMVNHTPPLLSRQTAAFRPLSLTNILIFMTIFYLASAGAAAFGKDKDPEVKAVIKYIGKDEDGVDKTFIADLLWGLDYTRNPPVFQDNIVKKGVRLQSLKVGIFAVQDKDGELVNIKYKKKTIFLNTDYYWDPEDPNKRITPVVRGYFYEDLIKIFKKKLKTSKATKDKVLKRQKLLRLLSWCDGHYLPSLKKKVEKELKRIDSEVIEGEKSGDFFKHTEKQSALVEAIKGLKDIGTVSLASSEHITLASDFLPPKTIQRMLKVGERVFRDFTETMYVSGVKNLKPIPEGEICRIYYFRHITTLEDCLRNASKFAPGHGNVTHKKSLERFLQSGGVGMSVLNHKMKTRLKVSMSALESRDRDDPEKINKRGSPSHDFTNNLISYLANALMDNWLGEPPVIQNHISMPWLSEGFSHYLCIKNLGVLGVFTSDFDFTYAKSDSGGGYRWTGDIEETMHRIAYDKSVEKFEDLIRISHYRNLKTESVAKSVSLIDFLIESNKIGFLNFLKDMQKHYKKLGKTQDQLAFINGLDKIVSDNLGSAGEAGSGMASRSRRKSASLESVEDMEKAWREWAKNWIKGKKKR